GAPLRHTEVITTLAFDRRPSFLATLDANFSSGDRTVRVWPLKSSNPPPTVVVGASAESLPALSPDGRSIVRFREYHPLNGGASPIAGAPRLENLDARRSAESVVTAAIRSSDDASSVRQAVSNNRRTASNHSSANVASRDLVHARRVRFSSNGEFVLTWRDPARDTVDGADDVLWEFAVYEARSHSHDAPAVIVLPRIPGPGPWRWAEAIAPTAMAISNRGDRVAVAFAHGFGSTDRDSQGVIWIWSRPDRTKPLAAGQGRWDSWSAWRAAAPDDADLHRSPIVSMAFSPDGDRLATGSSDDSVCIWSSWDKQHAERDALARLRHGADVNDVRYANHGRGARSDVLVTSSSDGKLRIWEHDAKNRSTAIVREFSHRAPIQLGMLNHDGALAISAGDDGRVKVWDATTGELTAVLESGRYVRDLAVARDGTIWTVSQSPGRSFPPVKPIFPVGWSPIPGGALPMPSAIQAWRSRSNETATQSAAVATLLAARRFAKNGQLVDMSPVE
ncbi:MAG TPA: hypothetical protein PLV92_22670, partial [Pirellulaceae bacterium]|nr:hypothetical protein [Pirellulaceae bacterium]